MFKSLLKIYILTNADFYKYIIISVRLVNVNVWKQ